MLRRVAVAIGALTLMLSALVLAPPAHAQGVRVGVLNCNVSSGFGFIIGSSRSINRFGVDIGYIRGGVLIWSVLAPTATPAPCALAGNFGGATAQATVGVGVGANVLIGGSANSITLQPVSIEGTTGLNVAAGIASMTLQCAPGP